MCLPLRSHGDDDHGCQSTEYPAAVVTHRAEYQEHFYAVLRESRQDEYFFEAVTNFIRASVTRLADCRRRRLVLKRRGAVEKKVAQMAAAVSVRSDDLPRTGKWQVGKGKQQLQRRLLLQGRGKQGRQLRQTPGGGEIGTESGGGGRLRRSSSFGGGTGGGNLSMDNRLSSSSPGDDDDDPLELSDAASLPAPSLGMAFRGSGQAEGQKSRTGRGDRRSSWGSTRSLPPPSSPSSSLSSRRRTSAVQGAAASKAAAARAPTGSVRKSFSHTFFVSLGCRRHFPQRARNTPQLKAWIVVDEGGAVLWCSCS